MAELDQEQAEQPQSTSQDQVETSGEQHSDQADFGEQSLDEHLEQEREEIEEIQAANEGEESQDVEGDEDAEGDEETPEDTEGGEYKPNTKYKVLDQEHEFDPKLKGLLTKETEPIIRELYEKAHGIDAIKQSRATAIRERDEVRGNYDNLVGEVARILQYKKAGDLDSFFESVQLDQNTLAKYMLEKIRIAQLPPEQQAVYTEREALRKRLNGVEQNLQTIQAKGATTEVQERLNSLDAILGSEMMKRTVTDFDTRNGAGSLRMAIINWAAAQPKDMPAKEAVEGFMKTFGMGAKPVQGQPKPGANANKRVVTRPKVKTIPNYGGGQASVTATKKPKSVEDLRKLARGETI